MKSCLKRRLQTGTALICSLAMAFSVLPVSAEESTQSLESKTSDLAGQLAGINQELVAISDQISTTEMQVEITNGEIQRTKDSLADTQAKEAQPVSYTHLDVYKRQIIARPTCSGRSSISNS